MIERLASKLGRADEVPNIELAEYLCEKDDAAGVKEIADGFKGADKAVANDCIKVLYEIGARKPELIAGYANDFLDGLRSKNNRIVWGSMTALALTASHAAQTIFDRLDEVIAAYENGSVITIDNSISVFAELCKADERYSEKVLPIILNHLRKCRPKEVPQHAERASVCVNAANKAAFASVLEGRMQDLTASQQARVRKVMKKLDGLDRFY